MSNTAAVRVYSQDSEAMYEGTGLPFDINSRCLRGVSILNVPGDERLKEKVNGRRCNPANRVMEGRCTWPGPTREPSIFSIV